MMDRRSRYVQDGKAALAREGAAIDALSTQLSESFADAVEAILACQGHVIVSGAGTSAAVAKRLAHLLTCVGAPALYLNAGDSAHGAAGAVTARDVLFAISKGGETDELNNLVRVARCRGAKIIALTENRTSTMAQQSDIVIGIAVDERVNGCGAIALGSSLAAAAVGDALCFVVLGERGYNEDVFRQIHPGGAVGKRLRAMKDS